MLIGTTDGVVMLERKNGGWEVASQALPGVRVESVCSTEGGRVAATVDGVFESGADPAEWKQTLPDVDARCLTVTLDGTIFVGADRALLYRRRATEEQFSEVVSLKDLPTYATWTFPVSPHLPNIRSIAASPTAPGRVYVGVEVGGVMVTEDGGETWQEARESIHPDIHGLAVAPDDDAPSGDGDHVFAVTGVGFYRSQDAARSWQSRCEGLETMYAVTLANDPTDRHRLYAAATLGRPRSWRTRAEGAVAKVYRSDDGGTQWRPLMDEGLVESVEALAVDADGAVYAGTHGGQVLACTADGGEWSVIADGLAPVNCISA